MNAVAPPVCAGDGKSAGNMMGAAVGLSYDVELPKDQSPRWPRRCVICDGESVQQTRIWAASIGWWTLVFWSFGPIFRTELPTCAECGPRLRNQRLFRSVMTWVLVLAATGAAVFVLGGYRGPLRMWLAMGLTLLFLSPLFLWETFRPPRIDITPKAKTVEYEFADEAYAVEFATLNGARIE